MGLSELEAQAVYEGELERIERAIGFACRRHGFSTDEAEEFRSEAHLHLIDRDYAVLRALEDREALPAFIAVVIQRLMLDFRVRRWGKWRPSAAARRAGEVALRLETLVIRDRLDFAQAYEVLRRNFRVTETRDQLYALLQSFPRRHGLAAQREVELTEDPASGTPSPEALLADKRQRAVEESLAGCLRRELAALDAEDRLLLRIVYLEGRSIAAAARLLGLEQRPLYRRLEKLQRALREALEREGVSAQDFRELVESRVGLSGVDLEEVFPARPSYSAEAGDDRAPGT